MVRVLNVLRPEIAVSVSMTQDDILDLCRVLTEFLQPIGDQLFGAVIVASVDQDDSLRCLHGPGRVSRYLGNTVGVAMAAEPVQVVENFCGL